MQKVHRRVRALQRLGVVLSKVARLGRKWDIATGVRPETNFRWPEVACCKPSPSARSICQYACLQGRTNRRLPRESPTASRPIRVQVQSSNQGPLRSRGKDCRQRVGHTSTRPRFGYKMCPGCFQPVIKDNEDDCDHIYCGGPSAIQRGAVLHCCPFVRLLQRETLLLRDGEQETERERETETRQPARREKTRQSGVPNGVLLEVPRKSEGD